MDDLECVPVTLDNHSHAKGPFFHGTMTRLAVGDLLVARRPSNYEVGRISNHIYFTATLDIAIWAAELAVALGKARAPDQRGDRGHIYVVEPTGPFEDDPNVTNKRFSGNITKSYRTRDPMRIVGVIDEWEPHPAQALQERLESLENLRRQGLAVIED